MPVNKNQLKKLLKLLKENNVQFVIIGAMAFPAYGFTRDTRDLDIFINPSEKNINNCINALIDFGYDIEDLTVDDFLKYKVLFRQKNLMLLDVHPKAKGVKNFDNLWKHRKKIKFDNFYVSIASLDDLITMKKAAGRTKDKADLEELFAVKRLKKEKTARILQKRRQ